MSDVNETIMLAEKWLKKKKNEESTIFYKFYLNSIPVPKVCEMIKIDSNLHVKLF